MEPRKRRFVQFDEGHDSRSEWSAHGTSVERRLITPSRGSSMLVRKFNEMLVRPHLLSHKSRFERDEKVEKKRGAPHRRPSRSRAERNDEGDAPREFDLFKATPRSRRTRRANATNAQSFAMTRETSANSLHGGSLVLCLSYQLSTRRGPGFNQSKDRNVRSKCRCSCVLQFTC